MMISSAVLLLLTATLLLCLAQLQSVVIKKCRTVMDQNSGAPQKRGHVVSRR